MYDCVQAQIRLKRVGKYFVALFQGHYPPMLRLTVDLIVLLTFSVTATGIITPLILEKKYLR